MFFHIDESGNTGNNLFDINQPLLTYGVLASLTNVDALGRQIHTAMLSKLGVESLHASQLGVGRIELVSAHLFALQQKMKFEFGLYIIEKRTYALVQLFEAVFDAGLNEAVPWAYYWTPLRFYVIHHLSQVVDDGVLRTAWELCTAKNIDRRLGDVSALLRELKARVLGSDFHDRLKEVMRDAFDFGIEHPDRLDFGFPDARLVSPNATGFQFVVADIARRLRKKRVRRAVAITIDHQQQFNSAQFETHRYQGLIADGFKKAGQDDRNFILNHPLYRHLAREEILERGLPGQTPVVGRSAETIGLQVTDIYLWLLNRAMVGAELPPGLSELVEAIVKKTSYDGITMDGMLQRWVNFEAQLPKFDQLSPEQLDAAKKAMESHRAKVAELAFKP